MFIDAYVTLGCERETRYTADDLLSDLDNAGVDRAVLAPDDRETAVDNRAGNDRILREAESRSDRFIPACTVNPWYGDRGVDELKRVSKAGARMLVLNPTLQGFLLNDTLADQLILRAAERGMPVYVHTGPHLYGTPWQLADCALRHPSATFIMGHSGATDFWNDVVHVCESAPNIMIEGSFARPFSFRSHVESVGAGRAVMGSAAPRNDLVFEWRQYREELAEERFLPVFGENLARLLGEGGGQ